MANPLFSPRASRPNSFTKPGNPVNEAHKQYGRSYNTFDYNRAHFLTARFADITPVDVIECVEGDKIPIRNESEILTHTLSSPLFSDLYLKKSYFVCDYRAILPKNWDKIYKNPTQGDDVPDDCNALFDFNQIIRLFTTINGGLASYPDAATFGAQRYSEVNRYIRLMLLIESIFSSGSVLSLLGCKLSPAIDASRDGFERAFSILWREVHSRISTITSVVGTTGQFDFDPNSMSISVLLDFLRSDYSAAVSFSSTDSKEIVTYFYSWIKNLSSFIDYSSYSGSKPVKSFPLLNISRLFAYQVICHQFYTNDKVDFIYNSKLYLENLETCFLNCNITNFTSGLPRFIYNGVKTEYDILSNKCTSLVLAKLSELTYALFSAGSGGTTAQNFLACYSFLSDLFNFNSSLRYQDYFTGSNPTPKAVGDVNIQVNDNSVSAIDVTRNILRQRFFNAVNRFGNTLSDYLNLMDGEDLPDPTIPRWLTTETMKVKGFEVENTTSDNQGNIVTILRGTDSRYMYEFECTAPAIILGLFTFEMPRAYSTTIDRFFLHQDRFDMFNKFMQYVGDQDIKRIERNSNFSNPTTPYGYQLRHMEYKQRFPIVSGGFVRYLPSYVLQPDEIDNSENNNFISPDSIRSRNTEFDRFYSSLTGDTLASYFHFIIKSTSIVDAKRQMAYSPTIL